MAPASNQKRVKNTAIHRPFMYGSTAKLFDPVNNPKPDHVPADHTHSWTVFLKGVDDADISYWLRRVQFKLHESIPNPLRTLEVLPGQALQIHETGWGEFEIQMKLYYEPISQEKAQLAYHHLRLHPYGETEAEKEAMRQQPEIISWVYEEQIFGEPYEAFWEILTGGKPPNANATGAGAKGKGREGKDAGERMALIPLTTRPGMLFSRETEKGECKKLDGAKDKVQAMKSKLEEEIRAKEEELRALRATV